MADIKNGDRIGLPRLKELLDYNHSTGVFTWRKTSSPRGVEGSIAGTINKRGYRMIAIDHRLYRSARLAWFYVHGDWPAGYLDHVNRVKTDDRLANLRPATISENAFNKAGKSKTGIKGVYKKHDRKNFFATIMRDGKRHYLGTFKNLEDAAAARRSAAQSLHGSFASE